MNVSAILEMVILWFLFMYDVTFPICYFKIMDYYKVFSWDILLVILWFLFMCDVTFPIYFKIVDYYKVSSWDILFQYVILKSWTITKYFLGTYY